MKQQLLTYGLHNNDLKHISEVANGLACNCVCTYCKQPLVAKNNLTNKKLAYFAHHSTLECDGAIETAMHLLAKYVLSKYKQLRLPDFQKEDFFRLGGLVEFDTVIGDGQRVCIGDDTIIPDSIGKIRDKQVFIEFAKTHFVDDRKTEIIKRSEIACVEIDLSEQILDEESLGTFFRSSNPSIYWINNCRREMEYEQFKTEKRLRKLQETEKESERQKQKALEEERERRETLNKLKNYKNNKTIKILTRDSTDGERVNKCPKKFVAIGELKISQFYNNEILRRIIDGENWNGKIYGHPPHGSHIFLGNEKIIVYPSHQDEPNDTDQQRGSRKTLYAGLKRIQEVSSRPDIGYCRYCKFTVDHLTVDDTCYEICSHS